MSTIEAAILALGFAALMMVLTRRLPVPYPSLLVLGGLAVATIPGVPLLTIEPSIALSIFLPAVLFQEASRMSWRETRSNLVIIGLVAPALVVGTCAAVAGVATLLFPGIPLPVAIVIGTVVAPADSTASKAVLARLKVPRRVIATLTSEGLVNDAVSVVIYKISVAAALGVFVSAWSAPRAFAFLSLGGVAFGVVAGWTGARLLRASGEPTIHGLSSLAIAFLTYIAGDAIGVSGALATVTAGIVCGVDSRHVPAALRFNTTTVWQLLTFGLNTVGFLLIGVQLPRVLSDLGFYTAGELALYAGAICATILAARLMIVIASGAAERRARGLKPRSGHSWREDLVSGWSGMRGLVSLAAACGLPPTPEGSVFPYRDLTLFFAFTAILFTLVVQGMTLAPMVRLLGVGNDELEERRRSARIAAAEAALALLDRQAENDALAAELEPIRGEYLSRIARLRRAEPAFQSAPATTRAAAIEIERRTLLDLAGRHEIDEDLLGELVAELDVAEVAAARRGQ